MLEGQRAFFGEDGHKIIYTYSIHYKLCLVTVLGLMLEAAGLLQKFKS